MMEQLNLSLFWGRVSSAAQGAYAQAIVVLHFTSIDVVKLCYAIVEKYI